MAKPEEFTIRIEPDGRIVLERGDVQETAWRRIVQLLEETVGPGREIEVAPEDPPTRHLHAETGRDAERERRVDLNRGGT